MGNHRAFTVNRAGEITWEWRAEEHIGPGTEFWEEYVPEDASDEFEKGGPESDWTHLNDIARLPNGNFQLSIRNFDVVIEVDPTTNEIVDVIGRPGDHEFLYEQHNPNRLTDWNTLIVADSENNRIVEYDLETNEPVWTYGGDDILLWPRDADRLPNGNTLITDSLNNRVIEVNTKGEVVWEYEGVRLPYSADRKGVPEEGGQTVPGWQLDSQVETSNAAIGWVRQIEGWASYVFPAWVCLPELLTLLGIAIVTLVGLVDVSWQYARPIVSRKFGN
jgi:hypothetical protein